MAWHRLRENWKQLKGLMFDRWRDPPGTEQDAQTPDYRRQELVELIQQLAREEIHDAETHSRRQS